ncbi:Retrovirus-related Pol polyprotein from transposon TNT 1-94 [Grifola frondosa]|uniref:Retrovirus-related Pol polyprotein from transposon TNT 1-94 n=1 Tax=Grifola frondosa TaxID=5627 RepID=A0A1C7M400_GRIFR|nr:Retrovirus-related Pol polyprotein from transposon TNT 1-94 [Grifola frondosa]
MSPADMSLTSSDRTNLYVVPKLAPDGSNWITYKERIYTVIGARGLMRHLLGTARHPPAPPPWPRPAATQAAVTATATPAPAAATTTTPAPTTGTTGASASVGGTSPALDKLTDEEYLEKVEAAEQKVDEYLQKELATRQQIYGTISDALLLRVKKLTAAADVWTAVQHEYEGKSEMYSSSLRTRLQNTKCNENTNVRTHLDLLLKMREELSTMGAPIADLDFSAMIFQSLPPSYGTLLTALTTASRLAKNPLTPDDVVFAVCEEYDRRAGNAATTDTALAARAFGKSKSSWKGGNSKADIECYNCKHKGHVKADCWRPGGGKEGQGPRDQAPKKGGKGGGKTTANAAAADGEAHAFTTTFDAASLTSKLDSEDILNSQVEVFDSGASRHISPYRNAFITFESISPRPVSAADGRKFDAVGKGKISVEIPCGDEVRTITLDNVLYAPDLAFCLISISCLDEAGYSVTFEKGVCRINDRKTRCVVGRIQSKNGLYPIKHSAAEIPTVAALNTHVKLTAMELHRRMGHISPAIAKTLVKNSRVKGVNSHLPPRSLAKPVSKRRSLVYLFRRSGRVSSQRS